MSPCLGGVKTSKSWARLQALPSFITIFGGGFIGSELTCALSHSGKQSKVDPGLSGGDNMGKVMPDYLCEWTPEKVRSAGVAR